MRLGLFESVWLGSQAFSFATTFNAKIGAWNTAKIANMASVCAHCHRLRVSGVPCKAWDAALRGLSAVGRGRSSPRPYLPPSVLHSSLE
jgi:hypothetical protein